jgi:hypothetical protein
MNPMRSPGAALVVGLLLRGGAAWGGEPAAGEPRPRQPEIAARAVEVLHVDGLLFKDKNGRLDRYEDWRLPVAERVDDLVSQMTIEEKAGLMVGPSLAMGPGGAVREEPVFGVNPFAGGARAMVSPGTTDAITKRHIVQFIDRENADPRTMATWLEDVPHDSRDPLFPIGSGLTYSSGN